MYKRYREENLVEEYSNGRGRKRPPLPAGCGYELELPVAADTSAAQPPIAPPPPQAAEPTQLVAADTPAAQPPIAPPPPQAADSPVYRSPSGWFAEWSAAAEPTQLVAADTPAAQPPIAPPPPQAAEPTQPPPQDAEPLQPQSQLSNPNARFDVILQPQRCRPLSVRRARQSEDSLWAEPQPTPATAALAQSPTAATQAPSSAPEAVST